MMTEAGMTEFFRGADLGARVRALGYQVTVMQDCGSIYIADPAGIGCIFDTRTGLELLRKLARVRR